MTANEIYDLCKEASIFLYHDSNLRVNKNIPSEMIEKIKQNKPDIVKALSGYCFPRDLYDKQDSMRRWVIYRVTNDMAVGLEPIQIFEGTAYEVDEWAREHKDDPRFTDEYTSKYVFRRRGGVAK